MGSKPNKDPIQSHNPHSAINGINKSSRRDLKATIENTNPVNHSGKAHRIIVRDVSQTGNTSLGKEKDKGLYGSKENSMVYPAQDDSIIDVTGLDVRIDFSKEPQPKERFQELSHNTAKEGFKGRVPFWSHQYVYQYSELYGASLEQRKFYQYFKESFLAGTYLDLNGNTNYAFILLFDLLDNDYERHRNLAILENHLAALALHYPKTGNYSTSFLITKMKQAGDHLGVERLQRDTYQSSWYDEQWKLGNRYKKKLNLTDAEAATLNNLWSPGNNFCAIEFCMEQVLRLFLAVMKGMEAEYSLEGSSVRAELDAVSDAIARKHFRYRKGSSNYRYSLESTNSELYNNLFKHCENAVREHYGHKRKLSTETPYHALPEVATLYRERIATRLDRILPACTPLISPPDEDTEIELNSRNTSRWKGQFEALTATFKGPDGKQFVEDMKRLGTLNQKNPSLENIFFEASKFIAATDREAALTLYVHYLYYDLQSTTFNHKPLTKTLQKGLFKTEQQLSDFEAIIAALIKEKDLEKAVQSVSSLSAPKRKRIQLDSSLIQEVQKQHSSTVELLNEVLQDEEDPTFQTENLGSGQEEISFERMAPQEKAKESLFLETLALSETQGGLLQLFLNSDFSISSDEVESFARQNGSMRNQLIDSINEICYDHLDDVLIEEDGEAYTIYEANFQQLIKQ